MKYLLLENPAPLFFAALMIALAAFRRLRLDGRMLLRVCIACGLASLAAYVAIITLNINRVGLLWHDEANILSIAAAYAHGAAMYHATSSTQLYSLFYGPSTLLAYAPFMTLPAHEELLIRLAIFAVNMLNAVLLYRLMRLWVSRPVALAMMPMALSLLLAYPQALLGNRGDMWLLLCVLIATLGAMGRGRSILVGLGAGVAGALAIDFKVTVVVVLGALAVILYRRRGARPAVIFGVTAVVVALGVFALPHISMANYAEWLRISGHQRFLPSTALRNVLAAAVVLTPVVLLTRLAGPSKPVRGTDALLWSCLGAAVLASVLTGSKDGAGGWHLWPVLPLALALAAEAVKARQVEEALPEGVMAVVSSLAVAGVCVTLLFAVRDYAAVRPAGDAQWRQKEKAANSALGDVLARYGWTHHLAMGEGAAVTDYRTDLRYELVEAGQEYFFDENGVVEGIKAGFPVSAAVSDRVNGCGVVWIMPHGEVPFSSLREGVLPVTTTPYVFPDAIRLHFTDRHRMFEEGPIYDLWKCPADPASPAGNNGSPANK